MSSAESQPGYVLHRRPYKEHSLLLEVYTPDYGRMSVLCRGAMGKKDSKSAVLQVFQPLLLSWKGRSDLKSLTSIDVPSPALKLRGNALFCGYYLNELLMYLTRSENGSHRLFEQYGETLAVLADSGTLATSADPNSLPSIELGLRRFELCLLDELGILPDLIYDDAGKEIEVGKRYLLVTDQGFVCISDMAQKGYPSYDGATLLWLAGHCPAEVENEGARRRESKRLIRILINGALNGKELKSREMLQEINEGKP